MADKWVVDLVKAAESGKLYSIRGSYEPYKNIQYGVVFNTRTERDDFCKKNNLVIAESGVRTARKKLRPFKETFEEAYKQVAEGKAPKKEYCKELATADQELMKNAVKV